MGSESSKPKKNEANKDGMFLKYYLLLDLFCCNGNIIILIPYLVELKVHHNPNRNDQNNLRSSTQVNYQQQNVSSPPASLPKYNYPHPPSIPNQRCASQPPPQNQPPPPQHQPPPAYYDLNTSTYPHTNYNQHSNNTNTNQNPNPYFWMNNQFTYGQNEAQRTNNFEQRPPTKSIQSSGSNSMAQGNRKFSNQISTPNAKCEIPPKSQLVWKAIDPKEPKVSEEKKNVYVWNKPIGKSKAIPLKERVIVFEAKLPSANAAIKSNKNENFVNLNKDLNKNKPLVDVRKSMVNNQYLSDVRFKINGKIYYGHKMFLITSSSMFHHVFVDLKINEMIIEEVDEENFLKILNYCYTGQLKITEDDVLQVLFASIKLDVRQATNICHGFISSKINPVSVFKIFEKAIELNNDMFKKRCLDFIQKNEEKCLNSSGFYEIALATLQTILEFCNFPREKCSELIQKWMNGDGAVSDVPAAKVLPDNKNPSDSDANPPNSGTKKKVITSNQRQKPKIKQQPQPQTKPPPPQFSLIPNLMDFDFPQPSIFGNPFENKTFSSSASNLLEGKLHELDLDDDVVCKDDDNPGKTTVHIKGSITSKKTEFARIDFVCKRSCLLHEFWFNTNLFAIDGKEIRVTISTFENDKRTDIHNRIIKNDKPGKLLLSSSPIFMMYKKINFYF